MSSKPTTTSTPTTAAVSPLRRRMIDDMIARNLGPHSQRSRIESGKRFGHRV